MTENSFNFNTGNETYVFNALRHVASGSLHRDVLVPIKVDPRRAVAAREQLLLNPLVSRQRNGPIVGRRGPSVIAISAIVPAAIIAIAAIPSSAIVAITGGFLPTGVVVKVLPAVVIAASTASTPISASVHPLAI